MIDNYNAAVGTMEESSGKTPPQQHHRKPSSRRSTDSKPPSRCQSLHRSSTSQGIHRNSLTMSQKKREDLLALHRDSCRLFQPTNDADHHPEYQPPPEQTLPHVDQLAYFSRSNTAPLRSSLSSRPSRSVVSSKSASPITMSPALRDQRSPDFSAVSHPYPDYGVGDDDDISEDDAILVRPRSKPANYAIVNLVKDHDYDDEHRRPLYQFTMPATTVIHWTSASTRRREYEKIDRNNRGIRGFWRKVAPKCLQTPTSRTPFFEEGKDRKGNYEGSVRRFRMDISDEEKEKKELDSAAAAAEKSSPSSPLPYSSSPLRQGKTTRTKLSCWS